MLVKDAAKIAAATSGLPIILHILVRLTYPFGFTDLYDENRKGGRSEAPDDDVTHEPTSTR